MLRTLSLCGLVLTAGLMAPPLLAALRGASQSTPRATPDSVGLSVERLQNATAVVRQAVADRKIAGAVVLVARHGKIADLEPVGLRDVATRAAMDERTLFRLYSQSKAVTAVAVMMLHKAGKLRPSDPVDGLCHILYKGQTCNGYPTAAVNTPAGCVTLGIDNLKQGVIARGIGREGRDRLAGQHHRHFLGDDTNG